MAISSAIFQAELNDRLWKRIHGPDADEVWFFGLRAMARSDATVILQIIRKIRSSAKAVAHLSPELQRVARDSYAESIHKVFLFAVCAAVAAYVARLPVSFPHIQSFRCNDRYADTRQESRGRTL